MRNTTTQRARRRFLGQLGALAGAGAGRLQAPGSGALRPGRAEPDPGRRRGGGARGTTRR
jgi:hypothetical protein